jgi:hypothetical protein
VFPVTWRRGITSWLACVVQHLTDMNYLVYGPRALASFRAQVAEVTELYNTYQKARAMP